jgi:hypothetical protein
LIPARFTVYAVIVRHRTRGKPFANHPGCSRNFSGWLGISSENAADNEEPRPRTGERALGHQTPLARINFLSNEDTGKQACIELAPGFFAVSAKTVSISKGFAQTNNISTCLARPRLFL